MFKETCVTKLAKPEPMTPADFEDLADYEEIIDQEQASFIMVGAALMAIRENKLYRASYGTFQAYCHARWDFTPQHALRLVAATKVIDELGKSESIGSVLINESQARQLTPLLGQPEELTATWRETIRRTNGKPTAAAVKVAVQGRLGGRAPLRRKRYGPEAGRWKCPLCGGKGWTDKDPNAAFS